MRIAMLAPLAGCTTLQVEPPLSAAAGAIDLGEIVVLPWVPGSSDLNFSSAQALLRAVSRLSELSYRVRTRAVDPWGSPRAPAWGFVAGNRALLDSLTLGASAGEIGMDERLAVLHVVPGSPAAGAGLVARDVIEQVDGQAAASGLRGALELGRRLSGNDRALTLVVRRGDRQQTLSLSPVMGAAFRTPLASDRLFPWDSGRLPLETAGDALVGFAIAHIAELGRQPSGRTLAGAAGKAGDAVDFSLSLVSLAVGLATLGGWSAKPVDIFDDAASHRQSTAALLQYRREAALKADKAALALIYAAGMDPADVVAQWHGLVRAGTLSDDPERLQALEVEAERLRATG
jgi:membrane-associated protease RseP (regulator of RpoE activity)